MTYTIAECTVNELQMIDRDTPKHVEFHAKNNFADLMHLVGLIKKFIEEFRRNKAYLVFT
jgi:hypothetical protein